MLRKTHESLICSLCSSGSILLIQLIKPAKLKPDLLLRGNTRINNDVDKMIIQMDRIRLGEV